MANAVPGDAPKTPEPAGSGQSGLTVLQFVKEHLGWVVAIATIVGSLWVASTNNAVIKKAVDESAVVLAEMVHLKDQMTAIEAEIALERNKLTQLQRDNETLDSQYAEAKKWVETFNLVKADEKEVVPKIHALLELARSNPDASRTLARLGERLGEMERRMVYFSESVPVDVGGNAQLQLSSGNFTTFGPPNLVLDIPCKAGDYVLVLAPLTVLGGPSNVYEKLALVGGAGELIGESTASYHVPGWSNGTACCIAKAREDGTLRIATKWRSDHPQGKASVGGRLIGWVIRPPAGVPVR
jgi:hypothetical protein